MALVLPLLLVLTFMMLEGANYIWNEHKVVMGVRDAARYASRLDFNNYTCPSTVASTAVTQIKNMARTGQITTDNTSLSYSRVSGWADTDIDVTLSCASSTGGLYSVVSGNAPRVKVVAHVNYPSLVGTTLGFKTTMRIGAMAESAVMGL
ncbi:MAG: pilus assembly protein [Sphingomonadales bacterium]|nr:pilus assembly protein [Sphingomonadales bacterium]